MTVQSDMTAALKSSAGREALKAGGLAALTSPEGKSALGSIVQAELVKGFANHKVDAHADRKEVFNNQEWLFDAVDGLGNALKDINDALNDINRVLQDIKDKV